MRVRVSGMVWLPKRDLGAKVAEVKKELIITPRKPSYGGEDQPPPAPIQCWGENLEEVALPRAYFFGSSAKNHDVSWEFSEGRPTKLTSLLRQVGPYAEQAEAIDAIVGRFRSFDGTQETGGRLTGILRGTTGFGKTNTALAIIQKMETTAVVVVHKEFLFTQWQKRIAKFLPDARVGICRGPKCDFEDKDIVIAMAASLAREDQDAPDRYPEEFYRHFGMLIVDEVHRVGAPTWSPIPMLFPAKYRLGLTATPRRKDGADKVFWWHLGEIVFAAKTETPKPGVRMVPHDTKGPSIIHREGAPRGLVMKLISENQDRNTKVVGELVAAMKSPAQRKVLVLSHFLEHLRVLESEFRGELIKAGIPDITTSFYVGEWFSNETTLSLLKRKPPLEADRERAIDAIYRHFRRRFFEQGEDLEPDPSEEVRIATRSKSKDWKPWRCAETYDGKRYVALYQHGFRPVCLDDLQDKGLIAMGKDYDIAQEKPKTKKRNLSEEELFEAERARVIFATYQMCAEGVDIPAVDTLGFATPQSDIEQAFGRGRRNCVPQRFGGEISPEQCAHLCPWRAEACQGKPEPIAFDVCDTTIPLAKRAKKYRLAFYKDVGAKVHDPRA